VMLFREGAGWRLTTNGLPESRIDRASPAPDPLLPARWLSMLPVLLRPDARSMLVIGLGGGQTLESVPRGVETVHVIELEREVVRAHEELAALRGVSPLDDPRIRLVVNDARGALLLTDARFDAIVSQPSHPWTMGASHLYTREFFSLAAEHLEPGGVFVQWIGLTFVDEALLRSLVATLLDVFPHLEVFKQSGAVLFAASDAPLDPWASSARALAAAPNDFARFGLRVAEDVAASWALDLPGARRFAEGADINTDDRNQLATRSSSLGESALDGGSGARLLSRYDPLESTDADLDWTYLVQRLVAEKQGPRAARLAAGLSDPGERATARGWALQLRAPRRAAEHFRQALARDPASQAARFGLLRARRNAVASISPLDLELAGPLEGAAAAVFTGWSHSAAGDWPGLRALEPELAAAELRDPSYRDAQRLRIEWRAASEDTASRDEAVEIAAALLQAHPAPGDVLLAARAFSAGGRTGEALQLLDFLSRSGGSHAVRRAGLTLLKELPPEVDGTERAALRRRLARHR